MWYMQESARTGKSVQQIIQEEEETKNEE